MRGGGKFRKRKKGGGKGGVMFRTRSVSLFQAQRHASGPGEEGEKKEEKVASEIKRGQGKELARKGKKSARLGLPFFALIDCEPRKEEGC